MIYILIILMYAGEAAILAFQHYLVMLGTIIIISSIIVPPMGGGHVRNN